MRYAYLERNHKGEITLKIREEHSPAFMSVGVEVYEIGHGHEIQLKALAAANISPIDYIRSSCKKISESYLKLEDLNHL